MHKRNKIKAIVAFAVALAFIMPASAVFANDGVATLTVQPVMSILPATQTKNVGNVFTVDVYIDPEDYLISGANLELSSFNPAVIQATEPVAVTFTDFFPPPKLQGFGTVDNVAGKITGIYELTTPLVGIGTEGTWLSIEFTAVGYGTSPVTMDIVGLPDENGNKIEPITVFNGEVVVEPIYYTLDIIVDPPIAGSVTQVPGPDILPNLYIEGTSVELNATPADPTWEFEEWRDDLTGSVNPVTIFMNDDKYITAKFAGEGWKTWMTFTGDLTFTKDTVRFGENLDALDLIDEFDVPKPPSPGAPYIYAYIEHDLPGTSHDILWEEIRFYNEFSDLQVWDLVVETDNDGGPTQIDVTITWNKNDLAGSQYDTIILYGLSDNPLKNMKTHGSYTFTAGSGVPDYFKIICANNHAPVAYNDGVYTTLEVTELNVPESLGVLANDYDEDGDPLTAVLDTPVSNGTLTLNLDGSFDYMPYSGFYGTVTFKYRANDGIADSNAATVTIKVVRLNRIHIRDGWNLFSIPVGENIDKTTIIVEYLGDEYTWADAITANIILGFTYGWESGGYTGETTLEPGEGYWMWAFQDCDLLIPSNVEAGNHITYLDVGWNLVGVHEVNIPKLDV